GADGREIDERKPLQSGSRGARQRYRERDRRPFHGDTVQAGPAVSGAAREVRVGVNQKGSRQRRLSGPWRSRMKSDKSPQGMIFSKRDGAADNLVPWAHARSHSMDW